MNFTPFEKLVIRGIRLLLMSLCWEGQYRKIVDKYLDDTDYIFKEQETDYEKRVKEFYETEQERERISKLLIEERMKVLELEEKVKRLELRIAVIELPAQNYNKTLVRAEQAESRLEKLRRAVDSVREERDWDAKECALEELYKAREEL